MKRLLITIRSTYCCPTWTVWVTLISPLESCLAFLGQLRNLCPLTSTAVIVARVPILSPFVSTGTRRKLLDSSDDLLPIWMIRSSLVPFLPSSISGTSYSEEFPGARERTALIAELYGIGFEPDPLEPLPFVLPPRYCLRPGNMWPSKERNAGRQPQIMPTPCSR